MRGFRNLLYLCASSYTTNIGIPSITSTDFSDVHLFTITTSFSLYFLTFSAAPKSLNSNLISLLRSGRYIQS